MDIGTAYATGMAYQLMGVVVIASFLLVGILIIFSKRKSQYYRKYLSDLYVAAKIKFFANEDNLDLVAEEKCFKKWIKKQSSEYRDLDESVANELKERIEDSKDKPKKA